MLEEYRRLASGLIHSPAPSVSVCVFVLLRPFVCTLFSIGVRKDACARMLANVYVVLLMCVYL